MSAKNLRQMVSYVPAVIFMPPIKLRRQSKQVESPGLVECILGAETLGLVGRVELGKKPVNF